MIQKLTTDGCIALYKDTLTHVGSEAEEEAILEDFWMRLIDQFRLREDPAFVPMLHPQREGVSRAQAIWEQIRILLMSHAEGEGHACIKRIVQHHQEAAAQKTKS